VFVISKDFLAKSLEIADVKNPQHKNGFGNVSLMQRSEY